MDFGKSIREEFECEMIEISCKKCYSINGKLKINVVTTYYSIAIGKIM